MAVVDIGKNALGECFCDLEKGTSTVWESQQGLWTCEIRYMYLFFSPIELHFSLF